MSNLAGILFGFYFLGFRFHLTWSLGLFAVLNFWSLGLSSLFWSPPVRLHGSTSCLQLQPSSLQPATKPPPAVQLQPSAFNSSTTSQPFRTSNLFRLQQFSQSVSVPRFHCCCCYFDLGFFCCCPLFLRYGYLIWVFFFFFLLLCCPLFMSYGYL